MTETEAKSEEQIKAEALQLERSLEKEFVQLLENAKFGTKYEVGQIAKGKVVQLEKDGALIDLGAKAEAYLPNREILNRGDEKNPEDIIKAGEEYEFFIFREADERNPLTVSYKRVEQARGWVKLEDHKERNEIVEGEVVSLVRGGVVIEVFGVRGFIPSSQLKIRGEAAKGTSLQFKILEMDKRKNKLICSQKVISDDGRDELRDKLLSELEIGQVISGEIVRVAEFGAFVDIGGIDGLLPVSEIAWQRISHPKDMLKEGDKISIKVLKIDKASGKISLSLKRLQADPWTEIEDKFAEGQIIKGKVVKTTNFGAFVEIYPGVEALLPSSEITDAEQDPDPSKYLSVGEEIEALLIKRFSPYERRISLSLKAAAASSSTAEPQQEEAPAEE